MQLKNLKNSSIKILIVGFGNAAYGIDKDKRLIKYSHFYALKSLNLHKKISAILDPNVSKIKFPKELAKVEKFSSLKKLYKKFRAFDLVIVLVPTLFAVDITKQILTKIKFQYLMIEKPVSTSLNKFLSLYKILHKKEIIWRVNYQRNFDTNINYLKKFISLNKPYLFFLETSNAVIQSGSHFIELVLDLFNNLVPVSFNDTSNKHRIINGKKDPNGVMILKNKYTTIILSFLGGSNNNFKSNIFLKSDKKYLIYNEVAGKVEIGDVKIDQIRRIGKNCEFDSKPLKNIKLKKTKPLALSYLNLLNQKKSNYKMNNRAIKVVEIFDKFNIKY